MRILCAPDSFKETLSAVEVAEAMAAGISQADPAIECDLCPVGDGGEGTMDALVAAMGGHHYRVTVTGPRGKSVHAGYAILADGHTAVIELAQASGLALLAPAERNTMLTSTHGTGELIRAAMDRDCDTIIVCLGGSATVDGATGIAQALGAKFYDSDGREMQEPMTGAMLNRVSRFERPPRMPRIRVACDVTNPLCGPNGAAVVYGPQKGATPPQVRELDDGLAHLARIVGGDISLPGAGSAGGSGFGLAAMCGGTLERGIDLVLDAAKFRDRCRGAALVLTGEGRLDEQSLHGKATIGVARAAAELDVPAIAIVGSTGPGAEHCTDPARGGMLKTYESLADRYGMDRSIREAAKLIQLIAVEIVRQHM